MMVPKGPDIQKVLEGFEPETVSREILVKNCLRLFDVIEKDYTGRP